MNVFINGELKPIEKSSLSLNNRGYNYGDGLFETLRVINSKIMFWEAHYFRLMSSMRILRMSIPMEFSPEYLEEKIIELIKSKGEFNESFSKIYDKTILKIGEEFEKEIIGRK
jgi:branched-chain amino acid aminotransferase